MDTEQIIVRLPADAKEALRKIAAEEKRSLNAQVAFVLEKFLEDRAN